MSSLQDEFARVKEKYLGCMIADDVLSNLESDSKAALSARLGLSDIKVGPGAEEIPLELRRN